MGNETDTRCQELLHQNPKINHNNVTTPLIRLARRYDKLLAHKNLFNTSHITFPKRSPWIAHTLSVNHLLPLHNNQLASCSDDNTIKIWDMKTGQCIRTFNGHTDDIEALLLLSDNYIASSSDDKTIKIWNTETGSCIRTLSGHTESVLNLLLLPDNRIASNSMHPYQSSKSTIKIWNIETGECLNTITCPGFIFSLAYAQGLFYAGLFTGGIERFDLTQMSLDEVEVNDENPTAQQARRWAFFG